MLAGVYLHYKGGFYQVLGVGAHSEPPHERFVVYISLNVDLPGPRIRIRPLAMWSDLVEWQTGVLKPRFIHIGDEITPNWIETAGEQKDAHAH